jgi:hypothetical protein
VSAARLLGVGGLSLQGIRVTTDGLNSEIKGDRVVTTLLNGFWFSRKSASAPGEFLPDQEGSALVLNQVRYPETIHSTVLFAYGHAEAKAREGVFTVSDV